MFLVKDQLIASALSIFSLLKAIGRNDDGLYMKTCSFLGWGSMFASRIAIVSLVTTVLRGWIVLLLFVHVLFFTIWVYCIAVKSYDNTESLNRCQLWILTFLYFGVPSLVLWPIMFDLNKENRPAKYLSIVVVENILMMLLFYFLKGTPIEHEKITLIIVIVGSLIAMIFLSLYIHFKPKYTEYVVLYLRRHRSSTELCGPYYEFFDIVFNLKLTSEIEQKIETELERKGIGTRLTPSQSEIN